MKISKTDLKKISQRFRRATSRILNCDFRDVDICLKSFLECIEDNKIIKDYLESLYDSKLNMKNELRSSSGNCHSNLNLGYTDSERVVNTYKVLKILTNMAEVNAILNFSFRFSIGSTKCQDMVKAMGDRFIKPFAENIIDYLNEIGMDMGYDEDAAIHIGTNSGQINLASGSSTINATQNNGIDAAHLEKLLSNVKSNISTLNQEKQGEVIEILDSIREEIQKDKPKKTLIKYALEALSTIALAANNATELLIIVKELSAYIIK